MIIIVSSARGGELSPAKEARGQSFNRQTRTVGLLRPRSVSETDSENKLMQEYTNMVFPDLTGFTACRGGEEPKEREIGRKR